MIQLFILILLCVKYSETADILYVVPFTSKSHDIFFRPIGLELAERGHNVTVITSFDVPNVPPNYHKIVIERKELWELMGSERPNVFDTVDMKTTDLIKKLLWNGGLALTEHLLNSTQMQDFLSRDNHFDLVISETFVQEAMYTFAHKYKTPLVLITAFGNCMRHNIAVGNPTQMATILYEFVPVENPTNFLGRLKNLYISIYEYFWWRFWYLKEQEALVKKYIHDLRQPVPSLYEMQQNASLFMINRHFSFDKPMAYLPNIIEIGGIHTSSKYVEVLPKDLEKILNQSEYGVVYVNFGTNVKSSEMPVEKRKTLFSVFGRLKHTVLWKWEVEEAQDMPPNVITRRWFPQSKILAHPNVKLFISHGGIMSTQEAVFNGVPILGIPIYADQYNNLLLAEEAGFGKILNYHAINEKTTEELVNGILQNKSYMIKAKEISKRFVDRPMGPLDTAIFWIEYVIRNNGAHFIKSQSINMHWAVYNMLDVFLFIAMLIAIFFYVIIKILSAFLYIVKFKKDVPVSKQKKC